MKILIIFLSFFAFTQVFALEWYCNEVASEWMEKGVTLQACGIGSGVDENTARLDAFNNAQKEFENICNKDTNCANNVINIDPQRTTCDKKNGQIVCHRLIYYHITDKKRQVVTKSWEPDVIEIKTVEKPTVINNTYHTTVHQHYSTIKANKNQVNNKPQEYRNYIKSVNGVSIYETNSRKYQGTHLDNPSESEINAAIKRGSRSGGMNRIYIHRN